MNGHFAVVWKRSLIEHTLAAIVASLSQRGDSAKPITAAMHRIDQILARDPDDQGESCGEFERVLVVEPLCVTFEVHRDEQFVYVLGLRYAPRRPRPT